MKRILTMILAVAMVFAMNTLAFAAEGDYVLGVSSASGYTAISDTNLDTIRPEATYSYYILVEGAQGVEPVSKNDVKNSKLDIKLKNGKGTSVIDSYDLKYDQNGNAYVEVKFVKKYVSVKETDVDFILYVTKNKSKVASSETSFYGTMENHSQTADERDEYLNLADIPVVEAEAYVKKIELDLGQNLSIFAKLYDGKKYYGAVTQDIRGDDDAILNEYPEIATVYHLDLIDLSSSGNYVRFDLGDKMYVYDGDLDYLGTTADNLPVTTKYYVASELLDVDGEGGGSGNGGDGDGNGEGGGEGGSGEGEGEGGSGGNGSTNPDTGVNGFASVAMVAGMLALAIAGAVAFKRQ